MDDEQFLRLVDEYLEPPAEANRGMAQVEIVWERDHPGVGSRHIWDEHGVTEQEVEEVLFEVPPYVESKRSPNELGRTRFWGATRYDRWLFVVCEDWSEGGTRFLKPLTAFEPDEGVKYWESIR
ncbi:MAG: hypothetical protein IIC94_05920 [Chloroflexi bacterium]|nr:hypothetical protein [Chloroflexota bacterium]